MLPQCSRKLTNNFALLLCTRTDNSAAWCDKRLVEFWIVTFMMESGKVEIETQRVIIHWEHLLVSFRSCPMYAADSLCLFTVIFLVLYAGTVGLLELKSQQKGGEICHLWTGMKYVSNRNDRAGLWQRNTLSKLKWRWTLEDFFCAWPPFHEEAFVITSNKIPPYSKKDERLESRGGCM